MKKVILKQFMDNSVTCPAQRTQKKGECWEDYGIYKYSSSKEGLKLRQNYLLTAISHPNLIQAGSPYLLSVFWNYSSTECWITVIILTFLLRGGGLASLFHLVPAPSCIALSIPLHHHLVMTWSFSLTLMKSYFSHPLGFKSAIPTGITPHQNRTEQAFFRYHLLEGPARCQRESKARRGRNVWKTGSCRKAHEELQSHWVVTASHHIPQNC